MQHSVKAQSAWSEAETLALRWQASRDESLLEVLLRKLAPFAERKIKVLLTAKGLQGYLDFYSQEITSWALFAVWRALSTWKPKKASLAHWLSLYSFGFAGRLLSKIRLDVVSLYEPVNENREGETLLDVLPANEPKPEEIINRKTLQERLATLPGSQQEVFMRRLEGLTLEEIGERLGFSRERVRQIEVSAIRALKRWRQ